MTEHGPNGGNGGNGANGDLAISDEAVRSIVNGMKSAIKELEETGSRVTKSNRGAGFDNMVLTSKEAGTGGLASDFEGFCERWEWGVRALMAEANKLAEKLGLSVGLQHMNDVYWGQTFKYAVNSANPFSNPGLSKEQLDEQGWGEILTPNGPNYDPQAMLEAQQRAQQQWANPDGTTESLTPAEGETPQRGGER